MKRIAWLLCVLATLGAATARADEAVPLTLTHATYAAALRGADGHVDGPAMVKRLQELGAGTYYWLLSQQHDWDDLKVFLPLAQAANIQVWPYLLPPTESVPHTKQYSEPFRLDYQQWGEEIAKMSLQFPNLTAWVIDDFYANHAFFTPEYLKEGRRRMHAVNPKLAFLPLMYFNEIDRDFVENYRAVIDGVVVAYPQDDLEIMGARKILNDEATVMPGQLGLLPSTPTAAGDYVQIEQRAEIDGDGPFRVMFEESDDYPGGTDGYHFKQFLVDGAVAWEEDVAEPTAGWKQIIVDVGAHVRGKSSVVVGFRLYDKKGVGNFGIHWRLRSFHGATGVRCFSSEAAPEAWRLSQRGDFEGGFDTAVKENGDRKFHIPFVVMTAAQPVEFKLRHGDPTPEKIGNWLKFCLQALHAKDGDGVVTYCLDLKAESPEFPIARKLFHEKW